MNLPSWLDWLDFSDWGSAIAGCIAIACGLALAGTAVVLVWSFLQPGRVDVGRITARNEQLVCSKTCYMDYSITLSDGRSFGVGGSVYRALAVGDEVRVRYQGILTDGVTRVQR